MSHGGQLVLHGKGFTLIELIITIAIVGILTAIAYPNYTAYVREAKRSDAHRALAKMANLQERWYSQFHRYTDDVGNLDMQYSEDGYYSMRAVLGAQSNIANCSSVYSNSSKTGEYTLMAIPIDQQSDDTECSCIFWASSGVRSSVGTRSNPKDCW